VNDIQWAMPPLVRRTTDHLNLRDAPGGTIFDVVPKGVRIGVIGTAVEQDVTGKTSHEYVPVIYKEGDKLWKGWVWKDGVE